MTLFREGDLAALYESYLAFEHRRHAQRVGTRQYAACQFDPSLIDVMTRDEFSAYFRRLSPAAQDFQIGRWQAGFERIQREESSPMAPS